MVSAIRNSALLLLAIYAASVQSDARAQTFEQIAADTQPTAYLIGDHKFRIPKSYVFNYARDHSVIGLEAMLPDLVPRDPACAKHGTCDKMVFIVLSTLPIPPVSKQFGGIFVDPTAEKRPGPFGLDFYPDAPGHIGSDAYAKKLSDGQLYAIVCLKPGGPDSLSFSIICRFNAPLSAGLSLRYEFKRSQLEDWKQIHTSILGLISSFEAE